MNYDFLAGDQTPDAQTKHLWDQPIWGTPVKLWHLALAAVGGVILTTITTLWGFEEENLFDRYDKSFHKNEEDRRRSIYFRGSR